MEEPASVSPSLKHRDRRRISIVVPVYCNEESLPDLFEELVRVEHELKTANTDIQLIFVDDGSKDNSCHLLYRFAADRHDTLVVKLTRNFGANQASKLGLRFVDGDCFCILVADLQDPPALILEMAEKWRAGAKYIICERVSRDDPLLGTLFSEIYYLLIRLVAFPNYPRRGYCLALMDKALLSHMRDSAKHTNNPLLAFSLGFTPTRIEYDRQRRQKGVSKWSVGKKAHLFITSIATLSIQPLRVLVAIGFLASLVLLVFFFSHSTITPHQVLSAILFLFCVLFAALGFLAEYLWRVFEELDKKPEAVIERVFSGSEGPADSSREAT